MDQATKDKVNSLLASHNRLVVTAPPGAGKSTLLPLSLLQGIEQGALPSGKILLLEPRRLAARQIAERMAELLGEQVGRTVGYRIRFENKTSSQTRIEVLTEGILTRMLVDDPTLDGISMVLFDEFHERNIHTDVALALTREAQRIVRPDLRIVLMSATIDTTALCQALDAPLVESTGRMYPVEVQRSDEELVPLIRRIHRELEGDILVFLPGETDIRRTQEALADTLAPTHVYPLYGMLPFQEQRAAIAPSREGERKVVLATPIAETSLTIQGVRVVIDTGLCRKMVFNPQNGLSHLETVPISLDMAIQRMGRAGRVAPGTCIRLWSLADEHRMAPCRVPELLDADLAPIVLNAAAWGEADLLRLPWLTPPPSAHIAQAKQLLQWLGALDENGRITPHGKRLALLPCHPRIAQMLLLCRTSEQRQLACDLAAILEEKDPLGAPLNDADIRSRLAVSNHRIRQISQQYQHILQHLDASVMGHPDVPSPKHIDAGTLLAYAYPERIAKAEQNGCGRFRMANGETAFVETQDDLAAYDWIAIASLNSHAGGGHIFLAAPLSLSDIDPLLHRHERVSWDAKRGSIVAQAEYRIGTLVVHTEPLRNADTAQLIAQAAQREGRSMLDFNDEVQNLQLRVATVAEWHPELELPDLSTDAVLQSAPEWLPLYIGKATTVAELKKIDLCTALWGLLSYEQQQVVDRLAPTHIVVPSGSRIRLEYRQGADHPILRVRLQECFGLTDTPRVDDGKRPILMELLSPGFKPVQLTQDLRSFWNDTYFEVRKELRRRYPKHAWPDNPLESEAVRGVKRKA
ncbi:MAG: ATP-dependent helicase HrpB [Bacteroidales bacterium]|nr:ATP-dependent helicase HrpB [Bacteroidales bacterium]